jgi:hypothetical protein
VQGTKNLPFGLTLRHPFLTSRIAAFGYPCSEYSPERFFSEETRVASVSRGQVFLNYCRKFVVRFAHISHLVVRYLEGTA